MNDFEIAHSYFKKVFSGNDPMKKKYTAADYPDINKLVLVNTQKKKVNKKNECNKNKF